MPDPVQLNFSKAQPISTTAAAPGGSGVSLDFSGAQPLTAGPDDPNGNYDFGNLGKVTGMRRNGRPATRLEAFQQQVSGPLATLGQAMGDKLQGDQQAVQNFGNSAFDYDQSTKDFMLDLANMAAMSGASKLAQLGLPAAEEESLTSLSNIRAHAPQLADVGKRYALRAALAPVRAALAPLTKTKEFADDFLDALRSPLEDQAPAGSPFATDPPPTNPPATRAPAPGPKSVQQLLNQAKTGAMQKFGAWNPADLNEADADLEGPLQESITLQKFGALGNVLKALQKK